MSNNGQPAVSAVESLALEYPDLWRAAACGVTRSFRSIPVLEEPGTYRIAQGRVKVVLVGGLSGDPRDAALCVEAVRLFAQDRDRLGVKIAVNAAPEANTDGISGIDDPARDLSGPGLYPPEDGYYFDATAPEARYLWRWVCYQAPHLVLEIRLGDAVRWEANDAVGLLPFSVGATPMQDDGSLAAGLGTNSPLGLGPIPALRLTTNEAGLQAEVNRLWESVMQARRWEPGPAMNELEGRRARQPLQVASVLETVYGHKLDPVVYTQGVGISGRIQVAALAGNARNATRDLASVTEPFLSGAANPLEGEPGGSLLAGLVWAYDVFRATGDQRARDLLIAAADKYQPRGEGQAPVSADPDFRVEDMFMAAAVLGRAFRLTGEERYADLLASFLADSAVQQENGLFWHARSVPFFWSRGNGFAALGFAEALTYLPDGHPRRKELLDMHRRHLEALRGIQLESGVFPQILDFPGSYGEFTSTAMIGYALARGLRRDWLESDYRAMLDLAWRGVKERVDPNGDVVDACISTGVQETVQEYLHRPAVNGFDDRSGSLALWFAAEMERLHRAG